MTGAPSSSSSSEHLLESTLLTLAEVLSRVRDLEGGEMFGDLFSFLCMLLDNKMSREAGEYGGSGGRRGEYGGGWGSR